MFFATVWPSEDSGSTVCVSACSGLLCAGHTGGSSGLPQRLVAVGPPSAWWPQHRACVPGRRARCLSQCLCPQSLGAQGPPGQLRRGTCLCFRPVFFKLGIHFSEGRLYNILFFLPLSHVHSRSSGGLELTVRGVNGSVSGICVGASWSVGCGPQTMWAWAPAPHSQTRR